MKKVEEFLDKYFWLVIIILSIPAFWALLVPGYFGASDDLHIAWLFEMHQTLLSGKIPPRFVPDLSFGFGYPLFNFVFPLPFYFAEIFHLLGISLVDSIKFLFLLTIPISAIFMCILLREYVGRFISLAGAILYIYTPYRAVDIYIRGAIGEIISFVFLPLILLAIVKISKSEDVKWMGIGGIALASLVLSHNISAYMFFPFIFLLSLLMILFVSKDKVKLTFRILLTFFLGLLISGYFWIPALVESKLIKYDTVFNFADHFPTIRQLITPYWGYGASVPGPNDGMSFFLGGVNILVILMGVISLIIYMNKFSKMEKVILIWSAISIVVSILLMNHRSAMIWQSVPLLPYFQFPWRFLIMTTFFIPILVISLKYFKFNNRAALFIVVLCLITSAAYFRPQDFLGRIDDYYINRYIPTPVASSEYLTTQEEYLRLPKYIQKRPDKNYPLASFIDGEIRKIYKLNDFDSKIEVYSENGGILNYNKYYFDGWSGKIDGQPTDTVSGKPFGQIQIQVPEGLHKVEITYKETGSKLILDWISVVSFLVAILLLFNLNLFKLIKSGKIRDGLQND